MQNTCVKAQIIRIRCGLSLPEQCVLVVHFHKDMVSPHCKNKKALCYCAANFPYFE
jgi:hypothetical protein